MIVVSNTTPLIGMAMAGRFELLKEIFGEIHIPLGVHEEMLERGLEKYGAREVSQVTWIKVIEVRDRLAVDVLRDELDKGESEAIVLARELGADWVLVDERVARRKLARLGFRRIGTLGILLKSKEAGLIESVRPDVDRLRTRGFRISRRVYENVLEMAGEG